MLNGWYILVYVYVSSDVYIVMKRLPPKSTRTDTLVPYTTVCRSRLPGRAASLGASSPVAGGGGRRTTRRLSEAPVRARHRRDQEPQGLSLPDEPESREESHPGPEPDDDGRCLPSPAGSGHRPGPRAGCIRAPWTAQRVSSAARHARVTWAGVSSTVTGGQP